MLALEGDGSGMYTVQALWTMAREGLDVTTVIFANRKYAILQVELLRVGAGNPGRKAQDMLSLESTGSGLGEARQRHGCSRDPCNDTPKNSTTSWRVRLPRPGRV